MNVQKNKVRMKAEKNKKSANGSSTPLFSAKPADPAPVPTRESDVGSQVKISREEIELVTTVNTRVINLQAALGARTEEFERVKVDLLTAIQQVRNELRNLVTSIAAKYQVNVSDSSAEKWNFDLDTGTFTRTS